MHNLYIYRLPWCNRLPTPGVIGLGPRKAWLWPRIGFKAARWTLILKRFAFEAFDLDHFVGSFPQRSLSDLEERDLYQEQVTFCPGGMPAIMSLSIEGCNKVIFSLLFVTLHFVYLQQSKAGAAEIPDKLLCLLVALFGRQPATVCAGLADWTCLCLTTWLCCR